MYELPRASTLSSQLSATSEDLVVLARRVELEAELQPKIDSSGWDGPASWACQLSLSVLQREIASAGQWLRCAADLAAVAARQTSGDA